MNDTFPHDTSGCATSANTVRGFSGSTVGPSGSHYIIGPLQKVSGPTKKEKPAMSHFWDTHRDTGVLLGVLPRCYRDVTGVLLGVLFGVRTLLTLLQVNI